METAVAIALLALIIIATPLSIWGALRGGRALRHRRER
jgi:hypothetical protein